MSSGWICLHRSLQDHWLFNIDESDKFFAWVDLLMLANHKTETFMLKNKLIECKRGQVAKSQITLQKRWRWSQNKLKRFLNLLEKERMIDFETNEALTLITICNYAKYQDLEAAESSKNSSKLEKSVFFVSKTDDHTDVLNKDISTCNGKENIDIKNDDGRLDGRPDGRPHGRTTDDQTDDIQQYNNVNNVNKKESNRAKRPNAQFQKPTFEEIKDYIQEKKYMVNPDKFFAFYESNGWKVGRNPMKCWKSAIASWNASNYSDTVKPKEKEIQYL